MKIIRANEAEPGVTGYICHLTDLEAKVLRDRVRKVSVASEDHETYTIIRGMFRATTLAGIIAPTNYFTGSLKVI